MLKLGIGLSAQERVRRKRELLRHFDSPRHRSMSQFRATVRQVAVFASGSWAGHNDGSNRPSTALSRLRLSPGHSRRFTDTVAPIPPVFGRKGAYVVALREELDCECYRPYLLSAMSALVRGRNALQELPLYALGGRTGV